MRITFFFVLSLFFTDCVAQWNDDTYFPKIGVPGEIDTVYGWRNEGYLGGGILNIGPAPGESYGRVWFTGLDDKGGIVDKALYYELQGGPDFDLRQFKTARPTKMKRRSSPKFYSIARPGSKDLCDWSSAPTIYWQQEDYRYDTSDYTVLYTDTIKDTVYYFDELFYAARFGTDSVCGIVVVSLFGSAHGVDSTAISFFEGGSALRNQGNRAAPTASISVARIPERGGAQGAWHDRTRDDLLTCDPKSGNYFYYRNEGEFSLEKFAESYLHDTLLASWSDTTIDANFTYEVFGGTRGLDVLAGRSSEDPRDLLLPLWVKDTGSIVHIFRGNQNLGNNPLTRNSAEFRFYPMPEPYGEFGFSVQIKDVGTITGSKNRVLYRQAVRGAAFSAYQLFYVAGEALDDTADLVYYTEPRGTASVDTITADGDGLQDVILGLQNTYTYQDLDRGKEYVGSIHVVHGSRRIPDKSRSRVSGSVSTVEAPLSVYPNPAKDRTQLHFIGYRTGTAAIKIQDQLGRVVYELQRDLFPGHSHLFDLPLASLPTGAYIVSLQLEGSRHQASFIIQR